MIEQAENVLRDLGFYDVRVRHHELRNADFGIRIESAGAPSESQSAIRDPHSAIPHCLARIEVGQSEIARLLQAEISAKVGAALREIGYAHVTVDLQGYRRGSTNESLAAPGVRNLWAKPAPGS
jgi:uncharacterized protein